MEIKIDDISVNTVKNAGTYTFGVATPWTVGTTTTGTYAYEPLGTAVTTLAAGQNDEIVYLGNKGGNVAADNNNDNALMLMPQTFAAEADGTFSFKFSLAVSPKGDGNFTDVRATDVPAIVNFSDFETKTWLPGKRYLYVIDFTPYLVGGKIRFNVYVNDWEDDEDTTLAETVEVAKPTKMSLEAAIDLHSFANALNPALTIFPISIPQAITTGFEINKLYGFDAGDVIRIECLNAAEAAKITLNVPGWALTIEDTRVVVLTCTIPTIKNQVPIVAASNSAANVLAAINALTPVTPATTAYTEYTVNVDAAPASATLGAITPAFLAGDRIRIVYAGDVAAGTVEAPTGWAVTEQNGTEVLLTKNE